MKRPLGAHRRFALAVAAACLLAGAGTASAHHSFAVFFSADEEVITLTGTVKAFRFANPHGTIDFTVKTKNGQTEEWRAETNSPSLLQRRGWRKDIIKPGDVITVDGWRARNGSRYMRLRNAKRADGTPIGKPFVSGEKQ